MLLKNCPLINFTDEFFWALKAVKMPEVRKLSLVGLIAEVDSKYTNRIPDTVHYSKEVEPTTRKSA